MSTAPDTEARKRHVIVHATDLHPDGGIAFEHGVALARDTHSKLYSLYACQPGEEQRRMPDAGELLTAWGRGEAADAVGHEKVAHTCCEDPVDTMLDFIQQVEPDLLVVGTRRTKGLRRFFQNSVSESLARNAKMPTLFVPIGEDGFIDHGDGEVRLKTVLAPISDADVAKRTAAVINDLVEDSALEGVEVYFMHVGKTPLDKAQLTLPESDRIHWQVEERAGGFLDEVVGCVREHGADLVVMPTRGHDSVGDVLRGSHTEKVVRSAPCPVLSIPLGASS